MSSLMGVDDMGNTGLVLGLGLSSFSAATAPAQKTEPHKPVKWTVAEPNLTLALSGESYIIGARNKADAAAGNKVAAACEDCSVGRTESNNNARQASPHSTVSSFSSPRPVKRERDLSSEEVEAEPVPSKAAGDEDDVDGVSARKKLRLTKEQSALLEESFKQHSTLNPKQKQALARQLSLRPRQVEVWFQNRRARTKLKQTEVDCEFLRKCCETLTDENRRLQKELQELKALKLGQPLYMHMPAATLTMCPSCERVGGSGVGDGSGRSKSQFSMAPKAHLYSPFSNPSAAC